VSDDSLGLFVIGALSFFDFLLILPLAFQQVVPCALNNQLDFFELTII
jgi:hypothetical protein